MMNVKHSLYALFARGKPTVSRIPILLILGVSCAAGATFLPPQALAQQAKARLGTSTVPFSREVDMSALPQLTPGETAATKSPPRPMGGGSDADYAAGKAAAAKNFRGPTGPTGAPPSRPQTGEETPGASLVFAGQKEREE